MLVGPRRKVIQHSQPGFFHRTHTGEVDLPLLEPAVDLPLQFNFGSPYSSSLIVFFDFEHEERKDDKICVKNK